MLWACKQLLSPLRYLRIRQGVSLLQSKAVYDWVLPIILTGVTVFLTYYFIPDMKVFTEKGLIGGFQKLMEILVPFYIAALAAVATFERKGLDDELKGEPAYLNIKNSHGTFVLITLTRRQYISYLFGYLAFLSLALFVTIIFCNLVSESIVHSLLGVFGSYLYYIKIILSAVFMVPIWQLIITTVLGVYFLSERLQVMLDPNR